MSTSHADLCDSFPVVADGHLGEAVQRQAEEWVIPAFGQPGRPVDACAAARQDGASPDRSAAILRRPVVPYQDLV